MKKQTTHAFGKKIYFLGETPDGKKHWLEEARWDCEWYWGGGYIETYTNNSNPSRSRDIESHQHFDSLFLKKSKCAFDAFNEYFSQHPFTNKEVWLICELMRSFYIAREYSDMLHIGGAHYTTNPAKDTIKSEEEEYQRINTHVIPKIMQELYTILGGAANV